MSAGRFLTGAVAAVAAVIALAVLSVIWLCTGGDRG